MDAPLGEEPFKKENVCLHLALNLRSLALCDKYHTTEAKYHTQVGISFLFYLYLLHPLVIIIVVQFQGSSFLFKYRQ